MPPEWSTELPINYILSAEKSPVNFKKLLIGLKT